ncbi:MAG: hypothetical protein JNL51_16765 [Chitinophagaceae bacterium]|nr:hypothetical protein [Chitinophagaceae bacterium]
MKRLFLLAGLLALRFAALACGACEKQQPELLRGITHGTGPDSDWDYVIIATMAAIVVFTLFFSVKWLIRPGEGSNNHIKRYILNNE